LITLAGYPLTFASNAAATRTMSLPTQSPTFGRKGLYRPAPAPLSAPARPKAAAPPPAAAPKKAASGKAGLRAWGRRLNRKQYWIGFAVCMTVSIVLVVVHVRSTVMLGVVIGLWMRRLRDIGFSAWWVLALVAAIVAVLALAWPLGLMAASGVAGLAELVIVAVLGAIPGDPGPNRFGSAPGQPTIAETAEVFS
jgi:uncharacterized membrane protein YhaH (DUF805 family)